MRHGKLEVKPLKSYNAGYCQELTAVSGFCIQEDAAGMHLVGMDVHDNMKVTGHSSPVMLKKYIRDDQLDEVTMLTDKYDYFRLTRNFPWAVIRR